MVAVKMALAALASAVLAIVFCLFDTRTKFGALRNLYRQCIIGIIFGILACLATQFGISYDGYVLNVRTAAPLTAGLLFGAPAGLIAGVIGAAYRWFSVFWGIPTYTRVACTAATLLAGINGAVCRKYMFGNKRPSWFYGVFIAVVTEVFHMLLIFLTHMDDIPTAFDVVRQTAIPMILANAASLFLSLLFAAMISGEKIHKSKHTRPIAQTFSADLFICVLLSFLATSLFTFDLQNNVSKMETERLLLMNISDVQADIRLATDRDLLTRTESIKAKLEANPDFSDRRKTEKIRRLLIECLDGYNVSEINLVGTNGRITVSSNPVFDGFNMASGGQAEEFLCMLRGAKSYVQDFRPTDYDKSISRKYAGMALADGGFIQVGYDFAHFEVSVRKSIENVALNRHIGQNGFLFILTNADGTVVSAPPDTVTTENVVSFFEKMATLPDNEVLSFRSLEGETYFYAKAQVEGYTVAGCLPKSEADFSRNISVYIGALLQLFVFFILFMLVFFLLKKIIVDNIHKINRSLSRISNGDLSTQVEIRENQEFASLSDDINTTVERLKGFIDEADKRIDMELAFAKTIQYSVLPVAFPQEPAQAGYELYALMDTAREVGGDFYDFYLLDENHLAFLIADVSGKGIPSAMFMMNAKSVIKNLAESGHSVSEVFNEANERLCEANEAGMFVTAWMGILDLQTGVVKFANAGHNPPLIKRRDGKFTYLRTRPSLVLAGMEGILYREGEFKMEKGDEIFLYTDGATEATDQASELFGEKRLQDVLNAKDYQSAEAVCREVKKSLDEFVGDAPQFDDITLLSLKYCRENDDIGESLTVAAVVQSTNTVTDFIDAVLEAAECSPKALMQINVAIDEIFSNVVHYAYPDADGEVTVGIKVEDAAARITFIDSGTPFNPLETKEPDITKSAEDRAIGGLGIFLVRRTMDHVDYDYRDGKNILTITKSI